MYRQIRIAIIKQAEAEEDDVKGGCKAREGYCKLNTGSKPD